MRKGGFAATMLLAVLLTAALAAPAYAVPLAEWEADEAKLLGYEPVTRADLPDEWQQLSDDELRQLMDEIYAEADEHYFADEYRQALPGFQHLIYLARTLGDTKHTGNCLNNIGLVYSGLGEYVESLTYYEQSLAICREIGDVSNEGTTLDNIGNVHRNLGQYKQALDYYEQFLAMKREIGDVAGEGIALNNIGSVYDSLGQYEVALDYHERSLAIRRVIGDVAEEAVTLNNIGCVYKNLGEYVEALSYYEQSLAIKREVGDVAGEGIALNNIGSVYDSLGQYEVALTYYEQSLDIFRALGHIRGEGTTLNNIGLVYTSLGQYEEALEYYEQSLAIRREIGDVASEGSTLNNIGLVHNDLGQYEEALEYFEQSLAIMREIGDVAAEGTALNNIGLVCDSLGQYEEALEYYEQSLAIKREIGDVAGEGATLNNIGSVYGCLGLYENALVFLEQSLATMREIGDVAVERNSLYSIGSVYRQSGWPEQAIEHYRGAFDIDMSQATQFTWESGMKGGLVDNLADTASLLASTQLLLHLDEDAFATVQSAKGVPLLQLLEQAQVQSDDPAVQEALNSYRDAQAALQKYRDDLYRLDEDDYEQRAYITARIEEYQAQANDAWDYIREHEPRLTEIIEVQGLSVEQVQDEIMQPGQVVLEYLVTDEEVILFCLPWEGELTVARILLPEPEARTSLGAGLVSAQDEDRSFDQWVSDQLRDLYGAGKEDSRQAGRELYELLVAPVADSIPAEAELIICPDRSLFLVPFEALVGPEDEYLLERHPLSYSTSATMLHHVKDAGGAACALVAGISFSGGEGGGTRSARDPLRAGLYGHRDFGPLAAVLPEARNVAALLDAQELLLEDQATEPALRESMPGCRVIHLATHGFLSQVPLLNGVVLYQEEQEEEEDDADPDWGRDISGSDGFLRMSEVMGIPLDGCELVALSCCHTAEGEANPGAGVMGMTQGFLYAGARSVLASLRGVHDDETRALMEQFYRNWQQEGMSKREALRQAKLWLLDEKGVGAAKWAPFVLYGLE